MPALYVRLRNARLRSRAGDVVRTDITANWKMDRNSASKRIYLTSHWVRTEYFPFSVNQTARNPSSLSGESALEFSALPFFPTAD